MVEKTIRFVLEIRQEFGKVSWPTRDELLSSTYVVLILSGILAIFIFGVDTALANMIRMLLR